MLSILKKNKKNKKKSDSRAGSELENTMESQVSEGGLDNQEV